MPTFDFCLICLGLAHQECSGFAVQRIGGVRVAEELGQEDFEDVDHVEHGRPGLVDDVQADRAGSIACISVLCPSSSIALVVQGYAQLVDVGMEDPVHEADAGALVWVCIWELNVDLPESALEWGYGPSAGCSKPGYGMWNVLSSGPLNRT